MQGKREREMGTNESRGFCVRICVMGFVFGCRTKVGRAGLCVGGRKKKDDRLFSPPKILGISLFFMRNRCGIQTKANKQHVANMSCHFKTKQCCIYQCQLLHIKCIIIGKEPFTQPKSLCVLLTECDKGKRRAITNLIV